MKKFWGYYTNGKYSVGCNGGTVYIYDNNGEELAKFKDIPYAYRAVFKPDSNIIAVKSTAGSLAFYDLDNLSLVKRVVASRLGAQDEGFFFSFDGNYFYNIEKTVSSTRTQLGVYETDSFSKVNTLFDDEKMVLLSFEFDSKTGTYYVLGYMRDVRGVFDYGFIGIFDRDNEIIKNICKISDEFKYLWAYKRWEDSGFTDKSLEWNYTLRDLDEIKKISIKEVYQKYQKGF